MELIYNKYQNSSEFSDNYALSLKLFRKENGKYLLRVVNQGRASAMTALPWGSWRSTRKRPTKRMSLIELYAVWEIVQYLTILGICRKLSKSKKTWQGLILALSYFRWQRKESSWSLRISLVSLVLAAIKGLCMEYNYFITE